MVEIIGKSAKVQRKITGLHTFDRAFANINGDIGFPRRSIAEIFGPTGVGKSTIVYSLSALLSDDKQDIVLADLEGFDPEYLLKNLSSNKFSGNIISLDGDDDEAILDQLVNELRKDSVSIGILDSIGAISPISEQSSELGEANMGRRGLLMAQFARKALKVLRDSQIPKTVLMTNHSYPVIGIGKGMKSPGGEVKEYISSVRIQVKRKFIGGKYEEFPDKSYIIEGTVVKNRWGMAGGKFNLFVLSGFGVHVGLTAMYDCIALKLANKERAIKLEDQNFGTLRTIIKKARENDIDFFEPFHKVLQNHFSKTANSQEEKDDE